VRRSDPAAPGRPKVLTSTPTSRSTSNPTPAPRPNGRLPPWPRAARSAYRCRPCSGAPCTAASRAASACAGWSAARTRPDGTRGRGAPTPDRAGDAGKRRQVALC
jgi:hypothetical protein